MQLNWINGTRVMAILCTTIFFSQEILDYLFLFMHMSFFIECQKVIMIVNLLRRRFRLLFRSPSWSFLKGGSQVKEVASWRIQTFECVTWKNRLSPWWRSHYRVRTSFLRIEDLLDCLHRARVIIRIGLQFELSSVAIISWEFNLQHTQGKLAWIT
jgi:hypothetical protein